MNKNDMITLLFKEKLKEDHDNIDATDKYGF